MLPASGGTPRLLAPLSAAAAELHWSPDGDWVATTAVLEPGTEGALVAVHTGTGELRRLTPPTEDGHYKEGIRWHPDGRRITYMCYCGPVQVRMAWLDARPPELFIQRPGYWDWYGAWSPDGRRFLFMSWGAETGLFELDPAAGTATFIGAGSAAPSWSRDGGLMTWSAPGLRAGASRLGESGSLFRSGLER